MAAENVEELDRFRQEWQEEVRARQTGLSRSAVAAPPKGKNPAAEDPHARAPSPPASKVPNKSSDRESNLNAKLSNDAHEQDYPRRSGPSVNGDVPTRQEPISALDHYEHAIAREIDGSLGDSLKHYRAAYRLDADVDRLYKKKHFPPSSLPSKPSDPNPSNAPVTVPNTAHHSLDGPSLLSTSDLIASFQSISITGEQPPTDASPAPPCPISSLPSEILLKVVHATADTDPTSLARLTQVCRRLAYIITTEDQIWKHLCESSIYGFYAMQYNWVSGVTWTPHRSLAILGSPGPQCGPLSLSVTYPNFRQMFHDRPRVRFNGCYISTVNYPRPGAATASQATWSSPVIIVTYYRYLRFFRDGTCISLCTTTEPPDVIPHLTKPNMHHNHPGGLPSAVMNQALRGRWRLKGKSHGKVQNLDEENVLVIHTQGADADRPRPTYVYKMRLQLRNTSKAPHAVKNNKLIWLTYSSQNMFTDQWSEFSLKNDKAFFWSRVKSYVDDIDAVDG